MEELQIPKLQNWWLGDGSYHLRPPIEERTIRVSEVPSHIDQNTPFYKFPEPEPLYVSKELSKELRGIVKTRDQFEKLFAERQAVEEPICEAKSINAEIAATANDVHYDPNQSFSCAGTDESFELTTETEAPVLLSEIDSHLVYLRDRLGRLGRFSASDIREQHEQRKRVQKRQIVMRNAPKAAVYSRTQTIDPVDFLNERCLAEISARERIAGFQKNLVERQCGGSSTCYIKRNLGPFRKQGKLKNKSIPRFHEQEQGISVTVYGQRTNPAVEAFAYVKNAHPHDERLFEATPVRIPAGNTMQRRADFENSDFYQIRAERPHSAQRAQQATRFVTYKSIEDERREITELKLHSKDENDVLQATAEILAQLRTDEQHLVTLLQDCEADARRAPSEGWYERKDAGFSAEYKQAALREQMQQMLVEMGGAPPSPVCDAACGE